MSHKNFTLLKYHDALYKCLNVLLLQCVTESAHKSLQNNNIEPLQIIITELQTSFIEPLECVRLLSSQSQLKCFSILQQVLSLVLSHTQLGNIIDVCLSWKSWYFIPLETTSGVLKHLFVLHQSLISSQTEPLLTDVCSILELATNRTSHIKNNPVLLKYYSSHFAHLSLSHLLHEMTNKREVTSNKNEDTGHSLIKLSADIASEEDDRDTDYRRVTFHRSQNIKKTSISKYIGYQ